MASTAAITATTTTTTTIHIYPTHSLKERIVLIVLSFLIAALPCATTTVGDSTTTTTTTVHTVPLDRCYSIDDPPMGCASEGCMCNTCGTMSGDIPLTQTAKGGVFNPAATCIPAGAFKGYRGDTIVLENFAHVEYIGTYAFQGTPVIINGSWPKLKWIAKNSFSLAISEIALTNLTSLVQINPTAFSSFNGIIRSFEGPFPNYYGCFRIRTHFFKNHLQPLVIGPEHRPLTIANYFLGNSFYNATCIPALEFLSASGSLNGRRPSGRSATPIRIPSMPKLRSIGGLAFAFASQLHMNGSFPQLESIDAQAFTALGGGWVGFNGDSLAPLSHIELRDLTSFTTLHPGAFASYTGSFYIPGPFPAYTGTCVRFAAASCAKRCVASNGCTNTNDQNSCNEKFLGGPVLFKAGEIPLTRELLAAGKDSYITATCVPNHEFHSYNGIYASDVTYNLTGSDESMLTTIGEYAFSQFDGILTFAGNFPKLQFIYVDAFSALSHPSTRIVMASLSALEEVGSGGLSAPEGSTTITGPFPKFKGCYRQTFMTLAPDWSETNTGALIYPPGAIPLTKEMAVRHAFEEMSTVTCIPDNEFTNRTLDLDLSAPDIFTHLRYIGRYAFAGMSGRLQFNAEHNSLEVIGGYAFAGMVQNANPLAHFERNDIHIYVGNSKNGDECQLQHIGAKAFYGYAGSFIFSGAVPKLTYLGAGAFATRALEAGIQSLILTSVDNLEGLEVGSFSGQLILLSGNYKPKKVLPCGVFSGLSMATDASQINLMFDNCSEMLCTMDIQYCQMETSTTTVTTTSTASTTTTTSPFLTTSASLTTSTSSTRPTDPTPATLPSSTLASTTTMTQGKPASTRTEPAIFVSTTYKPGIAPAVVDNSGKIAIVAAITSLGMLLGIGYAVSNRSLRMLKRALDANDDFELDSLVGEDDGDNISRGAVLFNGIGATESTESVGSDGAGAGAGAGADGLMNGDDELLDERSSWYRNAPTDGYEDEPTLNDAAC